MYHHGRKNNLHLSVYRRHGMEGKYFSVGFLVLLLLNYHHQVKHLPLPTEWEIRNVVRRQRHWYVMHAIIINGNFIWHKQCMSLCIRCDILIYLLGVKREGDEDREGARSLTWMRITVEFLVKRLSTAHFSAFWLPFSLSIATATNPFTPSFFSWFFHITLFSFLFQCLFCLFNEHKPN